MKFDKLRVTGFKSFVEPTEFAIQPGLTGVVGPNGCGKSNLVEALRWVMGENSYKHMRASGMDDVIFSGSGGAPGAQSSPKSALVLDNCARAAPAAFNDADMIEITRRIEREAGLDLSRQRQARSAPATCNCCSPTPPPARARRRWCGRARSAKSSPPSRRRAAASLKKPPASPGCIRAATRPNCASRPPRTI